MLTPKVGFVVYGVHKDGLEDPMGQPFVDDALIAACKDSLREAGLELVEHEVVVSTKEEAETCFRALKKRDDVDAVVLVSGTWVWAAHMTGALRDFAGTGKGIVIWTHPGSQGWRPVGGLVLHAALKEIDVPHRFVYGNRHDAGEIARIVSYCRASCERNRLNMSTVGTFGGRGMGQSCGVADPSQWMRVFGIDIDTRDTMDLVETARAVTAEEIAGARCRLQPRFSVPIPEGDVADRSIALYVAIRKILGKEQWNGYSIQSFPGFGDYYGATCFTQSMMLEDRVGASTLSDFNTYLSVQLMNDFSADPVYYGDLQHIDKTNNEIKIIGDGACPPSLAGERGPAKFAEHGIPTEGEAGGLSVDLVCKPGEGVLARFGRTNGEFEMVLTRCSVFEPSEAEIERRRLESGIPFWPHAFITAHCDIDALLEAWSNEYACLGYGAHLYDDIAAFCEQTGVRLIAL